MTLTLSPEATDELFQQENLVLAQPPDPDDALDLMYKNPASLGSGYWRSIQLRDGLSINIGDFRFCDRIITPYPDGETSWLEYHFHVSGEHQSEQFAIGAGQFAFIGSGYCPKGTADFFDTQPYVEVQIHIKSETLCSFVGMHRVNYHPRCNR